MTLEDAILAYLADGDQERLRQRGHDRRAVPRAAGTGAVAVLVRARFQPARTLTFPVQGPAVEPNERLVAGDTMVICPTNMPNVPDGQPCGARLFQGIETGIYVALTALLLYLAIRRIRRIA